MELTIPFIKEEDPQSATDFLNFMTKTRAIFFLERLPKKKPDEKIRKYPNKLKFNSKDQILKEGELKFIHLGFKKKKSFGKAIAIVLLGIY